MKLELPVVLSFLQGWLHQFYAAAKREQVKRKKNKATCMSHLVGVLSTSTGPRLHVLPFAGLTGACYSMRMRAPGWHLMCSIPAAGRWRDGFWPHAGSPGRVLHWVPAKLHPVPANLRAPHGLPPVALQLPGLPHRLPDHHALQLVGGSDHGRCVRKSPDQNNQSKTAAVTKSAGTQWTGKRLKPKQRHRSCLMKSELVFLHQKQGQIFQLQIKISS